MSSPFGPMRVIINPRAGRGAVERGWPDAKAVLDHAGIDYRVTVTDQAGHATRAARDALASGEKFVVAVGGDGTVNEVINGLMGSDGVADPDAVLGVVAAGSGCDFVKTFGLSQDPATAAKNLLGGGLWGQIDVARVRFTAADGSQQTRWFGNIAEAGLGADVVAAAAKMPKWLGGTVYKLAAVKEIARHEPFAARVTMHGRKARGLPVDAPLGDVEWEGEMTLLVVANCQFFGGGMKVAPRAIPGDGMLDVQIATGSKSDAMKVMQKIAKGQHIPNKGILEFLATSVTLEGPKPILIEADGEVLGTTPATFDVVPAALKMKV